MIITILEYGNLLRNFYFCSIRKDNISTYGLKICKEQIQNFSSKADLGIIITQASSASLLTLKYVQTISNNKRLRDKHALPNSSFLNTH